MKYVVCIARIKTKLQEPHILTYNPRTEYNSTAVLITIAFDMLLMVSLGLVIGINRRILIRYNLIIEGKETISEK